MGGFISRFRRKRTTTEVLEKLQSTIDGIEKDRATKEQRRKRVMGYVMLYSVLLYIVFATMYYFKYAGESQHWLQSIVYASPLLLLPVLVIFLRATICWYFDWSLGKNRMKLTRMRIEKKKILEEVMNTETYKVAKDILDKYGAPDDQSKALKPFVPTPNVPGNTSSPISTATPGQLMWQRQQMQTSTVLANSVCKGPLLRPNQLPRPLPDRNRSPMDKVLDYLLKDGPNQRMALICGACFSHNGMAMVEEFDYVCYKCAYCGEKNEARKRRPAAPALCVTTDKCVMPSRAIAAMDGFETISNSESDDDTSSRRGFNGNASTPDRSPSPKAHEEKKED